MALLDLLVRHLVGSVKPVWSVVHVASVEDEDRRHLHRELKLLKKDRTRVSHRMKGLLANQGLTLNLRQDLRGQLDRMRLWDGSPLPPGLRGRLERYVDDYEARTKRIEGLEAERRRILREEQGPVLDQVRQLYTLKAVGINTAWVRLGLAALPAPERALPVGPAPLRPRQHAAAAQDRDRGPGRKLLVALWRFLETGVIPEGALLKTDLRLR